MKRIRPSEIEWLQIQANQCTYADLSWRKFFQRWFTPTVEIVVPPRKNVYRCKFIDGRAVDLRDAGYRLIESADEYYEMMGFKQ